jgi:hypothetical protein
MYIHMYIRVCVFVNVCVCACVCVCVVCVCVCVSVYTYIYALSAPCSPPPHTYTHTHTHTHVVHSQKYALWWFCIGNVLGWWILKFSGPLLRCRCVPGSAVREHSLSIENSIFMWQTHPLHRGGSVWRSVVSLPASLWSLSLPPPPSHLILSVWDVTFENARFHSLSSLTHTISLYI